MFTLMKIFLKVDCQSVNEVKAGVKAKEDDKKKTLQKVTYNSGSFGSDMLLQALILS